MDRRAALQRMAMLTGGLALAPEMVAAMATRAANNDLPATATADRLVLLGELADTILPDTDTPGAKAAGAHKFIVLAVEECLKPNQRTIFWEGLEKFEADCVRTNGKSFVDCSKEQRATTLKALVEATKAAKTQGPTFWRMLKELTMQGYFTSEIGMTQALAYDPIPGGWIPDMKIDSNTKAWASYF
jgi:Gluconate 2-dehydrogenase subunit 3